MSMLTPTTIKANKNTSARHTVVMAKDVATTNHLFRDCIPIVGFIMPDSMKPELENMLEASHAHK